MDKKTPAGGGFSSPEMEARGLQAVFDEMEARLHVVILPNTTVPKLAIVSPILFSFCCDASQNRL